MPLQIPSPKDYKRLEEIEKLIKQGLIDEAFESLLSFTKTRPKLPDAWELLFDLAMQEEMDLSAWQANQHLLKLNPTLDAYWVNAVAITIRLQMPFTLKYYFEEFFRRFPNSIYRDRLHKQYESALPLLKEIEEDPSFPKGALLEDIREFELGQMLVSHGHYQEGRNHSLKAAKRLSAFPAPLNNVSLSYAIEGNFIKALQIADEVLANFPTNIPALGNKVQSLVRLGRKAETLPILETFRSVEAPIIDQWLKMLEACAYAGADELLITIFKRLKVFAKKESIEIMPYALHFAAVAEARLGNENEAKNLWKTALSQGEVSLFRQNLSDLSAPIGQKNGAWYFQIWQWLPQLWIERISGLASRMKHKNVEAFHLELARLIKNFQGFEAIMPILLEQGDPDGITFALHTAESIPITGLKEFALGQRGRDSQRLKAAQLAVKYKLIDASQPVMMYIKGRLSPQYLLNYEIYYEPNPPHASEDAQKLYEAAFTSLNLHQKAQDALELVDKALAIAPDVPQMLNLKWATLAYLGRSKEAEKLVDETLKQFPDYFFAQVDKARLLIEKNQLDKAEELLRPLILRPRFHISEYKALLLANFLLHSARNNYESAMSWLDMLSEFAPELMTEDLEKSLMMWRELNQIDWEMWD